MSFTLRNFYILLSLSLSIHFNCSWNFVSLWLWIALDLNFFAFVFMEFCWFVAVGCLDLSFFVFFFLCRFPRFLLLPLLSNLWQRRIMKFLLLDFLFPFLFGYAIFIGFLVSWDSSIWFQFWVCFVWYIVSLSSSFTLVFTFYKFL